MNMDEIVKELKREYYRQWREKPENKAKTKVYIDRHWQKKAQILLAEKVADSNFEERHD